MKKTVLLYSILTIAGFPQLQTPKPKSLISINLNETSYKAHIRPIYTQNVPEVHSGHKTTETPLKTLSAIILQPIIWGGSNPYLQKLQSRNELCNSPFYLYQQVNYLQELNNRSSNHSGRTSSFDQSSLLS